MIEQFLNELYNAVYNPNYKLSNEFKETFTPKCFTAAKNNKQYYKLDEQNVIIYNDTWNDLINKILSKIKYCLGRNDGRNVYKKEYYSYGTYDYFQIDETEDYKKYIIYLHHRFIVQLQTFKKEIFKNVNQIVKLKIVKSVGRESMVDINMRLRNSGVLKSNETLQERLVGKQAKELQHVFKLIVPNQIGYIEKSKIQRQINHCFKADVSSAFPSQLTKIIPTTKRCKINKIFEPTAEYPFVFHYKKGMLYGDVKIFNELDSAEDLKNKFMVEVYQQMNHSESRKKTLTKINIEEEDIYIACKAADITLKDVMNDLYNDKLNGNAESKMIMNSFIGYCQLNNKPLLAFISAVVIARQNHEMIERCKKLENDGNQILYIATDSIVWRGFNNDITTENKYLGSFTIEYKNCSFYGIQVGSYQIKTNENQTLTYCNYMVNDDYKKNLEFGKLQAPKEKKIWQK